MVTRFTPDVMINVIFPGIWQLPKMLPFSSHYENTKLDLVKSFCNELRKFGRNSGQEEEGGGGGGGGVTEAI